MDATLPALTTFALATSITPGPNNLMLMRSGGQFGLRRTLPHWLGVSLGFAAMILALGAGLSRALDAAPSLRMALKVAGAVYILWLAAKIARSGRLDEQTSAARAMTFIEAAAFQWANPKAWAMALTTVSLYAGAGSLREVSLAALVAGLVNFPCVGAWVLAGRSMRAWTQGERRRRLISWALATLIVLSLTPLLWER